MCHLCRQNDMRMAAAGSKAAQRRELGPDPARVNALAPTRHPGSKSPRRLVVAHRRRKQRAARRRRTRT